MKILSFILSAFLFFAIQFAHAEQININSADATSLASVMVGIGIKKAQAIVDYRTQNGNFKSVDELIHVKGIGPRTLEKNRDNLTVNVSREPATIKAINNETK